MSIEISQAHLDAIKRHGEEAFPDECCGFLLGKTASGTKCVHALVRSENASEAGERYHRFSIAPREFLKVDKLAREQGLNVLGFYHSHPDAEARPSHYDLDHGWPRYSYVIVSVRERVAREITSWVLREDGARFDEEPLQAASR